MLWLLLMVVIIGVVVYIADKKIKAKFEDKFNPNDWDLPGSVELPADVKPQTITPVVPITIAETSNEKIGYEKKPHSLANSHAEIFNAISAAVGGKYILLTNINVADVLAVVANNNPLVAQVAVKNIASRQFDFLICEHESLKAVCALVLGDHIEPVLANACESANLPVARFKVQAKYDHDIIRNSIFQALGVNESSKPAEKDVANNEPILDIVDLGETKKAEVVEEKTVVEKDLAVDQGVSSEKEAVRVGSGIDLKLCPNCSAVMLKRKAKNGANAGQLFWICSTYPNCRGMLAIK